MDVSLPEGGVLATQEEPYSTSNSVLTYCLQAAKSITHVVFCDTILFDPFFS